MARKPAAKTSQNQEMTVEEALNRASAHLGPLLDALGIDQPT